LGLRSEKRQRLFESSIVLVEFNDVEIFEFSLCDLSCHGSSQLK